MFKGVKDIDTVLKMFLCIQTNAKLYYQKIF